MNSFKAQKEALDQNHKPLESVLLNFTGVDGFDVYNCSIPFDWQGKRYIYGRVERREEWARSWVQLFTETGKDTFALVKDSMIYQLEDPYIAIVGKELIMGGTHVRKKCGAIDTYYGYFYKGTDLEDMHYYTTGPDRMKDIRLVALPDGLGVFSRPNGERAKEKYGIDCAIGFAVIKDLSELTAEMIDNAPVIQGLFEQGEWGGCNQCYLLDSGNIGVIGHKSFTNMDEKGIEQRVYTNIAFVMDPKSKQVLHKELIATRKSYPPAPAKKENLQDCAFATGIVMRQDGKADLYSGVGDTFEGRVVIEYPFGEFGKIVG